MLAGLYLRAWRHVRESRGTIGVYLTTTGAAVTLWAVSLAVPPPARYILWAVAVVVDASGPFLATWRGDTAPLRMEHLPERFGLFVILVLGELVSGIVTGIHDTKWAAASVVAGAVGFVIAAALWWIYFDVASAGNRELQTDDDAGTDERHDLYIDGHLPLAMGIVATGVGVEALVLRPAAGLPSPAGWAATGGIALCLLGAGAIVGATHRNVFAGWPWPNVALIPLLVLAFLPVPPVALVGLLALTSVITAIMGARVRRAERASTLAGAER